MENQLWWNSIGIPKEEKLNWFFVIINHDKRELRKLSDRIYREIESIEECVELEGKVGKEFYKIINFESRKNISKYSICMLYHGRVINDEKLYSRRFGIEGLEDYVVRRLKKGK